MVLGSTAVTDVSALYFLHHNIGGYLHHARCAFHALNPLDLVQLASVVLRFAGAHRRYLICARSVL